MATDSLAGVALAWADQPGDLPRQFESRQALEAELRRLFPAAEGNLSPIRGGRRQAEALLGRVQPARYAKGRNFLDGPVTRLSPFIRHGVLTLAEVRDAVFARTRSRQGSEKLINELGWRDYWQRLWQQLGVANAEADALARAAGLDSVMDRCVKIEHARLFGGLHWAGVNTGVISARRRAA